LDINARNIFVSYIITKASSFVFTGSCNDFVVLMQHVVYQQYILLPSIYSEQGLRYR